MHIYSEKTSMESESPSLESGREEETVILSVRTDSIRAAIGGGGTIGGGGIIGGGEIIRGGRAIAPAELPETPKGRLQ